MNVHRHLLMGYTMISSLLLAIPRSSHAFRATIIKTRSMVAFGDSSPAVQHIYLPIVQRVSYSSTISARRSSNSPADQAAPVNNESEETASSSDTWQNHRSRWARRKHRKKMDKLRQHENDQDDTLLHNENGLNWDKFEFGDRSVFQLSHCTTAHFTYISSSYIPHTYVQLVQPKPENGQTVFI
jgi:hypothetical protein